MTLEWMPRINQSTCTGCGACIAICPTAALGWQNGKAALLHPALCTYCNLCEDVCPVGAIELPYLIVIGEPEAGRDVVQAHQDQDVLFCQC